MGRLPGPARVRRLWETVRWLRPIQIYGRAWFRLYRPRPDLAPPPQLRQRINTWHMPARRLASMTGPRRFLLLNEEHQVSAGEWDAQHWPKLWRYNLHYFDDLNAIDATNRTGWHRSLIDAWLQENPPASGSGWEPYPVSLRIINWIKWTLAGNELSLPGVASLAVQARWLTKRLEWHLLGNHLFTNAKALVYAGLFFSGAEAQSWLRTGLRILDEQLHEQILGDGGQFERSPMYHALALEDLLDLANAAEVWAGEVHETQLASWRGVAKRMLRWLRAMCHPDGEIALFNDSAFGIAPTPAELEAYADRLGVATAKARDAVEHLVDSGYVRVASGPFVLYCDVGDLGPDFLPGHAHADTLSFELSMFGERWIVDSGCSTYAVGAQRTQERGTAAHNTVVVDGKDSSEVWSSFRVARRARTRGVAVNIVAAGVTIAASHDGYQRIQAGPIHRRQWTARDDSIVIEDELSGSFSRATAYLHLHPAVRAHVADETTISLVRGERRASLSWHGTRVKLQASTWHPGFNRSLPNTVIVADILQPNSELRLTL